MSLATLRTNPKVACDSSAFLVTEAGFGKSSEEGGRCKLTEKTANKVVSLTATASDGGTDWFFPYRTQVGSCRVDLRQPAGTLVVTGGMNGCGLRVYKEEDSLLFYHDTNCAYLSARNPTGTQLCKINYSTYAGPLEIGRRSATNMMEESGGKISVNFQHTLISVRTTTKWEVYVTGVHTIVGNKKSAVKAGQGKHQKFTPRMTCLLTSFVE